MTHVREANQYFKANDVGCKHHAYKCDRCGKWHATRMSKKEYKLKRISK